jgi:hypothetical protein
MQRELAVHGEVRKLAMVPRKLLEMCDDGMDAVRLCIHLSGFTYGFVADDMGINAGNFSRVLQGNGNFPTNKRVRLMELCKNLAPVQFECAALGLVPVPRDEYVQLISMAAELESIKTAGKGAIAA